MTIYTKTGDQGITSLLSGERVEKSSDRVEAYGTIDELDSALGLARALCRNSDVMAIILDIQKLLGIVMSEVASLGQVPSPLTDEQVKKVEGYIDSASTKLQPLTHFIIPGGCPGSGALDLARTITRRAERQLWRLHKNEQLNSHLLNAINRLSDLCFVLARWENEVEI